MRAPCIHADNTAPLNVLEFAESVERRSTFALVEKKLAFYPNNPPCSLCRRSGQGTHMLRDKTMIL